jgi:virginiamycin B lyase
MLEQAVYAGRNHTFSLACAVAATALLAAPARAADVARVPLGSSLSTLVASADGGAWVRIERRSGFAIGRAAPDGAFKVAAVDVPLSDDAALGPDGQAWFSVGRTVVRSDAAGAVSRLEFDARLGDVSAPGADGTLWSAGALDEMLARVTPQGTVSRGPLALPACQGRPQYRDMERASDGAVWIADSGCSRLIRLAPDGTPASFALRDDEAPFVLAPDAAGGVWFAQVRTPVRIGHADVGGAITRLRPASRHGAATDVAVGPDGSAWFAFASCALGRIPPGGTFAFTPAPIPAQRLAFDPAGGLWLASAARLVHATPAELARGSCDDEAPDVRLRPAFRRSISLAALRRGLRIVVREPSTVDVTTFYDDRADGRVDLGRQLLKVVGGAQGATVTYRVPAARLRGYERRLAANGRPEISFYVQVTDREGNIATAGGGGRRVTR